MTFVPIKDYDATEAIAQGEIGRFDNVSIVERYPPVTEACGLCDRAVEIYEKREIVLVNIEAYTHMHEYRGEFEAWVRVGKWIKTGRWQ